MENKQKVKKARDSIPTFKSILSQSLSGGVFLSNQEDKPKKPFQPAFVKNSVPPEELSSDKISSIYEKKISSALYELNSPSVHSYQYPPDTGSRYRGLSSDLSGQPNLIVLSVIANMGDAHINWMKSCIHLGYDYKVEYIGPKSTTKEKIYKLIQCLDKLMSYDLTVIVNGESAFFVAPPEEIISKYTENYSDNPCAVIIGAQIAVSIDDVTLRDRIVEFSSRTRYRYPDENFILGRAGALLIFFREILHCMDDENYGHLYEKDFQTAITLKWYTNKQSNIILDEMQKYSTTFCDMGSKGFWPNDYNAMIPELKYWNFSDLRKRYYNVRTNGCPAYFMFSGLGESNLEIYGKISSNVFGADFFKPLSLLGLEQMSEKKNGKRKMKKTKSDFQAKSEKFKFSDIFSIFKKKKKKDISVIPQKPISHSGPSSTYNTSYFDIPTEYTNHKTKHAFSLKSSGNYGFK